MLDRVPVARSDNAGNLDANGIKALPCLDVLPSWPRRMMRTCPPLIAAIATQTVPVGGALLIPSCHSHGSLGLHKAPGVSEQHTEVEPGFGVSARGCLTEGDLGLLHTLRLSK